MIENDVGRAIAFLRKRAGYTQKDLADRLGISDKAVSKWERGLGLPDISYLRKLSILLDTDTDSLLAGDVVHHDSNWTGIIVLVDNAYNIGAGTLIYDKPLVFFLLSYFLLVGIHSITIVGTKEDKKYIETTLGDGREYGISLRVITDELHSVEPEQENIMLVYGQCFIYGVDQTRFFQKAMINRNKFTMLVLPKKIKNSSALIEIDCNRKIINATSEEPLKTQYDFSSIPIVFFPAKLLKAIALAGSISDFAVCS